MIDSEKVDKLPVHETITVHDYVNLYKTDKWWAVVALCESFGRKDISLYQWQNRDGSWKRQSKWKIKNQAEWLVLKDSVEKLLENL